MFRGKILWAGVLLTLLAACAAGGGSVPPLPSATPAAPLDENATFTIRIPNSAGTASALKHPFYISPDTGSLRIHLSTVNGSAPNPAVADVVVSLTTSSSGCSSSLGYTTCTEKSVATIGTDVYTLTLYQSTNGTGSALATATPSVTVTKGVAANVTVTFTGVPTTLSVSTASLHAPADGTTHTLTFTVSAKDASGSTIVPPGNYSSPITLAISNDPNGSLSLSTTSIAAPPSGGTTSVTVTYNAAKALTSGTITLTSGSATATVAVDPLIYSPSALPTIDVGGSSTTFAVSEAGYSGAFTIGGQSSYVTTTCSPSTCKPASSGGTVTVTVSPSEGGSGTLTVSDTNSDTGDITYAVSYTVTAYNPSAYVTNLGSLTNNGTDLYFDDYLNGNVGQMTTSGTVSSVASNTLNNVSSLIYSGGYLWLGSDQGGTGIVRLTTGGSASTFSTGLPSGSSISGFSAGPTGNSNIWFADYSGSIGYITTAGAITNEVAISGLDAGGIAAGSDGALWFTNGTHIGRTTTAGSVTEYAIPSGGSSTQIVAGPDGNLWFTEYAASKVGRITTSGTVTEYSLTSGAYPNYIIVGPDNNLWFTESGRDGFGRITTGGVLSEFPNVVTSQSVGAMTSLGGKIWFIAASAYVDELNI